MHNYDCVCAVRYYLYEDYRYCYYYSRYYIVLLEF